MKTVKKEYVAPLMEQVLINGLQLLSASDPTNISGSASGRDHDSEDDWDFQ